MVTTTEGLALNKAYELTQAGVKDQALRSVSTAFTRLLDPRDLDRTFPPYAEVASEVIERARDRSTEVAQGYYSNLRVVENADGPAPELEPLSAEERARERARTKASLEVNGPATIVKHADEYEWGSAAARGTQPKPMEEAQALALRKTLGATTRFVNDGGRGTIMRLVRDDEGSRGWSRVGRGGSCYFCSMLIGRGPVYKSETTARFRSHDHCDCYPMPFFGESGWTRQAKEYREVWNEVAYGKSGNEAINAFRKAHAETFAPASPSEAARVAARTTLAA